MVDGFLGQFVIIGAATIEFGTAHACRPTSKSGMANNDICRAIFWQDSAVTYVKIAYDTKIAQMS